MKRGLGRAVVLVVFVLCAAVAQAQVRGPARGGIPNKKPNTQFRPGDLPGGIPQKGGSGPSLPVLGSLGTAITKQQAEAMTARQTSEEYVQALRVVAHFLQHRPDQVEGLKQLLQLRAQAVYPLLQGIIERERQLYPLLHSGGDPADIGRLVVEIYQLFGQIAAAQADFIAAFEDLLNLEQRGRLQAMRLAARLQPLLPAFQKLYLL
ncbi:MAG: hypothetical protein ACE5HL_01105 [Terriglobia bacterium]